MAHLTPDPTGKERAFRIRLDHYKSWDAVTRFKWGLAALAFVAAAAGAVWAFWGHRSSQLFSHGPLSASHATWESDCQVCHSPGVPLRAGAVSLSSSEPTANLKCQTCHYVADHYSQPHRSDQSCASCHVEHRGREFDLNHVSDKSCVTCHASLASVAEPSGKTEDVSSFPTGHPEFLSLPTDRANGDPGNLGFSHSRHMRLGLGTSATSNSSDQQTYGDLPEDVRDQYMSAEGTLTDLVQLECASCHELQSAAMTSGGQVDAADRGTFLPVNYQQHCAACHQLSMTASEDSPPLPHGLTGDEMRAQLEQQFRSRWFETEDEAIQQELKRPVPGRPQILRDEAKSALESIAQSVMAATTHVGNQCRECHEMKPNGLDIEPTNVPAIWLPKSHFDHHSHRAIGCQECHPGAYASESKLPLPARKHESNLVMIPGKENCASCHAPQTASGGGVSHDCMLCHRYHVTPDRADRYELHQAHGNKFSIEQFLRGGADANSSE